MVEETTYPPYSQNAIFMRMSQEDRIFFNRPYVNGRETRNIEQVLASRKLSGDGVFTVQCQEFFENSYGFGKTLLTTSCTDALEMASLLLEIQPGDEVILPSYTFVSTANAFALRGATLKFADSCSGNPNIDPASVEQLMSKKTRAVVAVHYGGFACNMGELLQLTDSNGIHIVEDAAHAIDSYYHGRALGSIGSLGTMSFHETKNITAGECGLIAVNDASMQRRAEIIREKGTNRKAFFRGETDRYSWVDLGSSFLPSEITAAVLAAQLETLSEIQTKRVLLWNRYHANLKSLAETGVISLPEIPDGATVNGHLFYIVCRSLDERSEMISHLNKYHIDAVFHYLSLHSSPYFRKQHNGHLLPNSDKFMERLLRLPMYYELSMADVDRVCECISRYYKR